MTTSSDDEIDSPPAAGSVRRVLSGDLPARRARAAHAAVVTTAYCVAVALLCSSGAVEYGGTGVGAAVVALVALHLVLGYVVAGRWAYFLCVLPAPCAAIVRADSTVGDVTDYGTLLAVVWIAVGLPIALALVWLGRRARSR